MVLEQQIPFETSPAARSVRLPFPLIPSAVGSRAVASFLSSEGNHRGRLPPFLRRRQSFRKAFLLGLPGPRPVRTTFRSVSVSLL